MMHCVGRRGAARGALQAPRRALVGGAAAQHRALHSRAQNAGSARSYSVGAAARRDAASAASFFLDAKAACKNKRCALGQDLSGIVASPSACGEDSFFLSPRIVGVADGVGGWNENGVDPGEISRCLMRNAGQFVRRQAELERDVSTLDVLSHGYAQALADDAVEAGSTTACIVKIKEAADGQPVLEYSNLGDSGFCIIRDGKVVFRSKFQYYGRAPYQLAKIPLRFKEYGAIENHPSDSDSGEVPVENGDIVVLATDGVWDNFASDLERAPASHPPLRLWNRYWRGDVASLVDVVAENPDKAAENIVLASVRHNLKPDDVTVIVAKVVKLSPKL